MGKGVKKDTEKAIHYYKLASDKGDISARFSLAQFLLKNKRDEGKAVRYLQSIVQIPKIDLNLLASCEHSLAECFENGTGIKKSAQNALHYYKLSAEHGNDLAQDRLGDAYLKGELGLNGSPENAMEYYELAANQGNAFSLMAIGKCYEDGIGVAKSLKTAFDYFKKSSDIALEKSFGTPIHKLAKCYELGIGVGKSLETAIYYYKISGENGLIDSYHQMSRCYHELGGEENEKKAAAYLKIAEAGKKIETEEKITSMKSHHGFGSTQNFFFIDKESIKQLEDGQDNVELVLDFRKDNLLSKETQEALEENRFGSYKNKGGKNEFNFPKKYLNLIEKRQRDGKLTKIVLLKTNEKQIIDVDPEDLLEESKDSKEGLSSFIQDEKYLQVLCDITHCFPGLKKGQEAYLTYVNEEVALLNNEKKVMLLNHFTPWNMDEKAFEEILKSERLVVFVTCSEEDTIIYITKKCAKKLIRQGGVVFCYPHYVPSKSLEKADHMDFELKERLKKSPETGAIGVFAHTRPLEGFSQEQYASICKAGASILSCKDQLGGSENLLVGGMFVATNEKMNTPIRAIKLHPDPNQCIQYFYISETELDNLETNSNILKIKPIDMEDQSIQKWKKIVDESRLIAITKDEQGGKLLIHQDILEERPFLAQMLHKICSANRRRRKS